MFIPSPDGTYFITHVMTWAGKRMTVNYYKHMNAPSADGLPGILDHFADSYKSNVFDNLSAGPIVLSEHVLRDVGVTDGGVTEITTTAHTGGCPGFGAEALPLEVAAVISLRTGLLGRSRRGRIFVPAWYVGAFDQATGGWDTTALAAHQTSVNAWLSDSDSAVTSHVASSKFVIASKQIDHVAQNPRHLTDVTSMPINPWPCSQRRRQPQHHGRLR